MLRELAAPVLMSLLFLGCGGSTTPSAPAPEKKAVAEAPVGTLKNLAKALESPKPADRKKAADEINKIGPPARPLQSALKQAIEKEPDAAVKTALAAALERTGG
jgi:cytochrome c556